MVQSDIFVSEAKTSRKLEKGHFNDLSKDSDKFMCRDEFVVKNSFLDKRCGFNFFPRKFPDAVELYRKHTKLTNVVEQTRKVSTYLYNS